MHADHLASILLVYILHIYSALMNTASFTRHIHIALRMFALALVSVALSSSANPPSPMFTWTSQDRIIDRAGEDVPTAVPCYNHRGRVDQRPCDSTAAVEYSIRYGCSTASPTRTGSFQNRCATSTLGF